jgi:protein-L-isoaspartate O-methyltransferase
MRGVNFMKTSKTAWYKPDELKTAEELSRREQVVEQCDPRSDFGSYRRILLGDSFEASQIAEHNDLSPKRKLLQLKAFLRLEKISTVLDLGCGIGVTSNVLSQLFSNAKVTESIAHKMRLRMRKSTSPL